MKKIKVIIKRTDESVGHVTWISDSLRNLQKTVDGPIEAVTICRDPAVVLICNEEGNLRGDLEPNFFCGFDRIVGDVIVCGAKGEEFGDIPITLDVWRRWLREWGNRIDRR